MENEKAPDTSTQRLAEWSLLQERESLWTNIDVLSKCHLSLELPTCSFESEICLSSAQLSGEDLIVPDEGLALTRRHFNEIYALQNPNRLYFLSNQRNFGLTLTPDER